MEILGDLQEALRIKEALLADEVVAVSIGPKQSQDTIRTALSMGADRGILVESGTGLEPLSVAKILAAIARKEQPGLFLLGKQAIDDDFNQTGQMLAALLGWPQAAFASSVVIDSSAGKATVVREVSSSPAALSILLQRCSATRPNFNGRKINPGCDAG